MSQTKTFYYKFNPVNVWMIFNAVLFIMILHCCIVCPCLLFWWQTQVIIGVFIFSTLAWGYKYVLKHKMAVIDDEGITIDHCNKLPWKDVENAEEKTIRCWFKKYDVIVLNPKKGIDYKYNFLQRHNCGFTAFSIPLYPIVRKEDIKEIRDILSKKVKFKKA